MREHSRGSLFLFSPSSIAVTPIYPLTFRRVFVRLLVQFFDFAPIYRVFGPLYEEIISFGLSEYRGVRLR